MRRAGALLSLLALSLAASAVAPAPPASAASVTSCTTFVVVHTLTPPNGFGRPVRESFVGRLTISGCTGAVTGGTGVLQGRLVPHSCRSVFAAGKKLSTATFSFTWAKRGGGTATSSGRLLNRKNPVSGMKGTYTFKQGLFANRVGVVNLKHARNLVGDCITTPNSVNEFTNVSNLTIS